MTEDSRLGTVKTVYYLPGHGGRLSTGLVKGLLSRGVNVTYRETVSHGHVFQSAESVKAHALRF